MLAIDHLGPVDFECGPSGLDLPPTDAIKSLRIWKIWRLCKHLRLFFFFFWCYCGFWVSVSVIFVLLEKYQVKRWAVTKLGLCFVFKTACRRNLYAIIRCKIFWTTWRTSCSLKEVLNTCICIYFVIFYHKAESFLGSGPFKGTLRVPGKRDLAGP